LPIGWNGFAEIPRRQVLVKLPSFFGVALRLVEERPGLIGIAPGQLWSPKMERACAANDRAATCTTAGVSSPAILNMFGSINSSPCDAVNVVASAPV